MYNVCLFFDQIDNIKAQNAEYKTRLGIDETVVPKDADTKVEIVWYEWQEAPDVTWSSGSFTKLYGYMKQRGGEVYRITKTIYGKCVYSDSDSQKYSSLQVDRRMFWSDYGR